MPTPEEIRTYRMIALAALETNPGGFTFIRRNLKDNQGGRCAIGLIGEALHVSPDFNYDTTVYYTVASLLDTPSQTIWYQNDQIHATYAQVAAALRRMWGL